MRSCWTVSPVALAEVEAMDVLRCASTTRSGATVDHCDMIDACRTLSTVLLRLKPLSSDRARNLHNRFVD